VIYNLLTFADFATNIHKLQLIVSMSHLELGRFKRLWKVTCSEMQTAAH